MVNIVHLSPMVMLLAGAGIVMVQMDEINQTHCDCNIMVSSSERNLWIMIKCERNQEMDDLDNSSFQYELQREWNKYGFPEIFLINTTMLPNSYNLSAPADYGNYTCKVTLPGQCCSQCKFWFNSTFWWKVPGRPRTSATASYTQTFPSSGTLLPEPASSGTNPESTNSTASNSSQGQHPNDRGKRDEQQHLGINIGIGVGVVLIVGAVLVIVFGVCRRKKAIIKARERGRHRLHTDSGSFDIFKFRNRKKHEEKPSDLEEIPRKTIRYHHIIGSGNFGTVEKADVWNVKRISGGAGKRWMTVAIKSLNQQNMTTEAKTDFLAEIALMRSIPPHANIIQLYASCTAHEPYLMFLEFASRGDLKKYLQDQRKEKNYARAYGLRTEPEVGAVNFSVRIEKEVEAVQQDVDSASSVLPIEQSCLEVGRNEVLTSRTLLSFALQISRGLEHLTENRIVHRDVAARNILLFDHNVVKISDFGLAIRVGQADVYERTRKVPLPARWMAPESLLFNQFNQMSDVWSYGVFLWELVALGSTPYPGLDRDALVKKIIEGELLTCPAHSSDVINDIMKSCWKRTPSERPTFTWLCGRLEELLEDQVEYLALDQLDDHVYYELDD